MTSRDWTLESAMASWACPVCLLTQQDDFNFLAKQLYAWATNEALALDLVAQGGFCAQHASDVMELASGLSVASIYERFLPEALVVLDEWAKQDERESASSANSPLLHPDCPVCVVRRKSEVRHVTMLLARLEDQAFRKRYEASRGLCLPHLSLAIEKAPSRGMRLFLLKAQLAQIQRLRADLASSKQKLLAVPQREMTPRERTAWMTVVEKFAGKSC